MIKKLTMTELTSTCKLYIIHYFDLFHDYEYFNYSNRYLALHGWQTILNHEIV